MHSIIRPTRPPMTFDKLTAATIILGSIFFFIAAFSPISRIFGIADAARKLEIITAAPYQWTVAQIFFSLGSIVVAVGVGMLAYRMAGHGAFTFLAASAGVMTVGAVLWTWHVYLRAVDPALFTAGGVPAWLFISYSVLTMAGLALLGGALLQTGLPQWVGWLSIGAAGFFLVLAAIFGDMPPFVYYIITLVVGIVIYRAAANGTLVAAIGT